MELYFKNSMQNRKNENSLYKNGQNVQKSWSQLKKWNKTSLYGVKVLNYNCSLMNILNIAYYQQETVGTHEKAWKFKYNHKKLSSNI